MGGSEEVVSLQQLHPTTGQSSQLTDKVTIQALSPASLPAPGSMSNIPSKDAYSVAVYNRYAIALSLRKTYI